MDAVVVENAMVEEAVVVENEVAAVPGEKAREEANGDEEGATVVEEEEGEGEAVAQGRAAEASPTTLAHQRGGSCSLTASPIAGRMQQTATYATSSLLQLAGV